MRATLAATLLLCAAAPAQDAADAAPLAPRVFRDLAYATVEGVPQRLLSLDVYAPREADAAGKGEAEDADVSRRRRRPVLLMIHGGGWRTGDKANRGLLERKVPYFVSRGWVFVSINYRLSPAVRHPAHVQDVARALAWVRERIDRYGGDPERIVVMGHSAGAHLAALVATDARRLAEHGLSPAMLAGVVLLDGAGYDIPRLLRERPAMRRIYEPAFGADEAGWRDASPITHVASGAGIPPFLVVHTARPEAASNSRALVAALVEADVEAYAVPAPGETHASINRDLGRPGHGPTEAVGHFLALVCRIDPAR